MLDTAWKQNLKVKYSYYRKQLLDDGRKEQAESCNEINLVEIIGIYMHRDTCIHLKVRSRILEMEVLFRNKDHQICAFSENTDLWQAIWPFFSDVLPEQPSRYAITFSYI